jgi:hypothetical protein
VRSFAFSGKIRGVLISFVAVGTAHGDGDIVDWLAWSVAGSLGSLIGLFPFSRVFCVVRWVCFDTVFVASRKDCVPFLFACQEKRHLSLVYKEAGTSAISPRRFPCHRVGATGETWTIAWTCSKRCSPFFLFSFFPEHTLYIVSRMDRTSSVRHCASQTLPFLFRTTFACLPLEIRSMIFATALNFARTRRLRVNRRKLDRLFMAPTSRPDPFLPGVVSYFVYGHRWKVVCNDVGMFLEHFYIPHNMEEHKTERIVTTFER